MFSFLDTTFFKYSCFCFICDFDPLPSSSPICLCHPYRLVWQYMIFLCNSGESVWSCWKENPRGFSCHYPSCVIAWVNVNGSVNVSDKKQGNDIWNVRVSGLCWLHHGNNLPWYESQNFQVDTSDNLVHIIIFVTKWSTRLHHWTEDSTILITVVLYVRF